MSGDQPRRRGYPAAAAPARHDTPARHGELARAARLYGELADERFWCEQCGRVHPLRAHRTCRASR